MDFDKFGIRINLGVTIDGPRGELEYMADLMGISTYTDYLLLNRQEVLVVYGFIVKLNEQGNLLLQCEAGLKERDRKIAEERKAGEFSRNLNWILGGTTAVSVITILVLLVTR